MYDVILDWPDAISLEHKTSMLCDCQKSNASEKKLKISISSSQQREQLIVSKQ